MDTQIDQEWLKNVASWGLEEWNREPSMLFPQELAKIVPWAAQEKDPVLWRDKLIALVDGLSNVSLLETVGGVLNQAQLLVLVDAANEEINGIREKLQPLFVGMQQPLFRTLLAHCSDKQLALLQKETMSEALLHHLTLLSRELISEIKAWSTSLALQANEISALPVEEHESSDVAKILFVIDSFHGAGRQLLGLLNRSLSLAWNSNRTDLIDQLSCLKEQCQKTLSLYFEPREERAGKESLDLKSSLQEKLDAVFNRGAEGIERKLLDEEPAIEALVSFSIWYPKDYWEIGLLPEINSIDQLEFTESTGAEQERQRHRERLFQTAADNLKRLGLSTLGDLKKAGIYSKRALSTYIQSQRALPPGPPPKGQKALRTPSHKLRPD